MSPTIHDGEEIAVEYGAYERDFPDRWDVVAFTRPSSDGAIWIFRVAGLPDDVIDYDVDGLLINGRHPELPQHLSGVKFTAPKKNMAPGVSFPFTVPQDSYFVLGDNSATANDSRLWGVVHRKDVLGRIVNK